MNKMSFLLSIVFISFIACPLSQAAYFPEQAAYYDEDNDRWIYADAQRIGNLVYDPLYDQWWYPDFDSLRGMTKSEQAAYIENLDYGGIKDWRLASLDEATRFSPGLHDLDWMSRTLNYFVFPCSGRTAEIWDNYYVVYIGGEPYIWMADSWLDDPGATGYSAWVVSDTAPIPIPGAVWLLGSSLIAMIGIRKKLKKY